MLYMLNPHHLWVGCNAGLGGEQLLQLVAAVENRHCYKLGQIDSEPRPSVHCAPHQKGMRG